MRKTIKAFAAIMVLALLLVPTVAVVSDADDTGITRTGACTTGDFSDNGGGWLKIKLTSPLALDANIHIVVYESGTDHVKANITGTLNAGETKEFQLNFSYDSSGTKYVDVLTYRVLATGNEVLLDAASEHYVQINVSHSVWKSASTYVVIVVVVIVIIIALILVVRTTKKTKADTAIEDRAFTQMREEKAAKKAGNTSAPSSEKQTYKASGEKKRKSK